MTLRSLALGGVAALALAVQPAAAATPEGWYLGFGAGWTTLSSLQYTLGPPAGPQSGKVDFGDNAAVNLTAGYRFPTPLRLEGELQFADYDANLLRPAGLAANPLSGDVSNISFFANALYDIPLSQHFSLTLGAGLGATQVDPNIRDAAGDHIHDAQTAFSWHLIAGISAALSDQLEMQIDYRYQEADSTDHSFFANRVSPIALGAKNSQVVMASLRWFVSPAAPPPPPQVKTFLIFFDFDKTDLNAQAVATIAEAVNTARQNGTVRILVTGHTDTAGSMPYNQSLSERRAMTVKSQMVADGLAESEIMTTGRGYSEPLVATGPGVREPQNRRAVIDLGG